jgi:hypothetical protein
MSSAPFVAGHKLLYTTSQLTNGKLETTRGAHTGHDQPPWLQIDLGSPQPIGDIVTYNRFDGWQSEVLPLTVEVSTDGINYTFVGERTRLFSQWIPWKVQVHGQLARFIRYRGVNKGYLCLAEAEVFAP